MRMFFSRYWSRLLLSTLVLASSGIATKALAEEIQTLDSIQGQASQVSNAHISPLFAEEEEQAQVTSVSQLSDVQPTDWAFQALQSLVERYGCIAGYPDGTFRGNRAATRYELAAALNACLDQISDRFATKEDLEAVKALQEEFKAELATLKGKVDGLEARTATLEAQAFSTTTKLRGEAIFAAGYVVDEIDTTNEDGVFESERVFAGDRVRLTFDTSFSGTDRLRTRLEAGNLPSLEITGQGDNRMARLGFADDTGNIFQLDELNYQFKPTSKLKIKIDANAGEFQDNVDTFNPYLESSGNGALSRFGRFNPIFRQGGGGSAGVGVTFGYQATKKLNLEFGYLADNADTSTAAGGLIGGSYAVLAQLGYSPSKKTRLGLTYVRSFDETNNVNVTSSTTGTASRRPFGNFNTLQDHFGFQFTTQPANFINLSGWVGYTIAYNENNSNQKANLINWAFSAQFPDLFGRGNLGYILVGQQPRIISSSGTPALDFNEIKAGSQGSEPEANFHIEAGYKFKVNGNITITPGVIVIFNAENGAFEALPGNDTTIVPVIRTTFTF
jgi:hypothetical protein